MITQTPTPLTSHFPQQKKGMLLLHNNDGRRRSFPPHMIGGVFEKNDKSSDLEIKGYGTYIVYLTYEELNEKLAIFFGGAEVDLLPYTGNENYFCLKKEEQLPEQRFKAAQEKAAAEKKQSSKKGGVKFY